MLGWGSVTLALSSGIVGALAFTRVLEPLWWGLWWLWLYFPHWSRLGYF